LIDDDLRAVGEVSELRLPARQPFRRVEREPVVASDHSRLAQRAVVDLEATLPRPEVGERRVPAAVVYVGKHRVPLRERAAPAVLPAEADGSAAVEQRREREVLAGGPIERLVPSAVGEMRAL